MDRSKEMMFWSTNCLREISWFYPADLTRIMMLKGIFDLPKVPRMGQKLVLADA